MPADSIIVVASHRRSGTHLTIDSLRNNANGVAPSFLTLETLLPKHKQNLSIGDFKGKLRVAGSVIIKTHTLPDVPEFKDHTEAQDFARQLIAEAPTLYVVRHGPDVLVSYYEYQRALLPRLAGVSFSEFLRTEKRDGMTLPRYWQSHVSAWVARPRTKIVHYENFHDDYFVQLETMCDFLGLSVVDNPVDMVMSRNKAAQGKSTSVMFRKGGVGDWTSYFSEDDLVFFESEVAAAAVEQA